MNYNFGENQITFLKRKSWALCLGLLKLVHFLILILSTLIELEN